MNKSKIVLGIIAVIFASVLSTGCVSTQKNTREDYINKLNQSDAKYNKSNMYGFLKGYDADMVDASKVLPTPPEVTDAVYYNDYYQYYKNKQLRNTSRGDEAIKDVNLTIDFITNFSEAFGMELSEENTPAIWRLMQRSCTSLHKANSKLKKHFKRIRPFIQFNDVTGYPNDEEHGRNSYSYPSSHTTLGFGAALILAEINPDRQNEIFKKGYECGQSRVILGYHYQSDVDASKLVASMALASLHSNPDFRKDLAEAVAEYKQKIK